MSDIILKKNKEVEEKQELNINDLIKGLVDSQTVMNYAFAGFKTETEQKFNEVNTRINEHDILIKKKIQLAPNEAKIVKDKIKDKVKDICEENGLEYHKIKSRVFPRAYRKINDKYAVATYRELPEYFWEDILENLKNLIVDVKDLKNQVA